MNKVFILIRHVKYRTARDDIKGVYAKYNDAKKEALRLAKIDANGSSINGQKIAKKWVNSGIEWFSSDDVSYSYSVREKPLYLQPPTPPAKGE